MVSRAFHIGRGNALSYTLNAAYGIYSLNGKNATPALSSASFIPQSGYSATGSIADGSSITITGPGGFGTKPVSAKPLLWMPVDSTNQLSPSSLGRITSINNLANIAYTATGGPVGAGYAKGSPVVTGDSGTVKIWAAACDVDSWGAGSPYINDYSAKYYLYRQKYQNFGSYDHATYNSNIKIWRVWARSGTADALPDVYFTVSNDSNIGTEGGPSYSPGPDFARPGQAAGTPDANAWANIVAFNGGLPGTPNSVTYNNWCSEEWATESNQSDPGANPPTPDNTSVKFNWYVEGLNSNNSWATLPVDTYQWQQFYFKGAGIGQMLRYYFWHYITDASSSGHNFMLPVGSYIGYGPTYLDDSWCRVHCRDNATRSAFTKTEIQIPSAWSDTSVTITLRKGRFASAARTPVIVTDNSGVEHYVGDIVWP